MRQLSVWAFQEVLQDKLKNLASGWWTNIIGCDFLKILWSTHNETLYFPVHSLEYTIQLGSAKKARPQCQRRGLVTPWNVVEALSEIWNTKFENLLGYFRLLWKIVYSISSILVHAKVFIANDAMNLVKFKCKKPGVHGLV